VALVPRRRASSTRLHAGIQGRVLGLRTLVAFIRVVCGRVLSIKVPSDSPERLSILLLPG
jgi:hypothetical protein